MLTNANGRSKLGLCSAKHSLRCCFHSDYACEGTHLSLTAVFEKKSGIFVYRGMVHRLKNVNMKGERGSGGGGRRKRRQSRRETPRVTPVWHFCQTRQEETSRVCPQRGKGRGRPSVSEWCCASRWEMTQETNNTPKHSKQSWRKQRQRTHQTVACHYIMVYNLWCKAKEKEKKKEENKYKTEQKAPCCWEQWWVGSGVHSSWKKPLLLICWHPPWSAWNEWRKTQKHN